MENTKAFVCAKMMTNLLNVPKTLDLIYHIVAGLLRSTQHFSFLDFFWEKYQNMAQIQRMDG